MGYALTFQSKFKGSDIRSPINSSINNPFFSGHNAELGEHSPQAPEFISFPEQFLKRIVGPDSIFKTVAVHINGLFRKLWEHLKVKLFCLVASFTLENKRFDHFESSLSVGFCLMMDLAYRRWWAISTSNIKVISDNNGLKRVSDLTVKN